MDGDILVL